MELYFHPLSGCSRRVLSLVGHLGIDYTPHIVQLAEGAQKQPSYLALNPNGKVPTLVDGDLVLWESVAILRHLARTHKPALLGEGPAMTEVDRWVSFGLSDLGTALANLNAATGLARMRGQTPDPEAVEQVLATAKEKLEIVQVALESTDWLVGDQITLAEFTIVGALESSLILSPLTLDELPVLKTWFERVQATSGWPEMPSRPKG